MLEINVKTKSGSEAIWSFQYNLIMLHSDFISAQWEPDSIGVEVLHQGCSIKVGMHPTTGVSNYQSFCFSVDSYDEILLFFKFLRFPCHTPNPMNYPLEPQK